MAFQQPFIFLLVEFPANAMDCAHSTLNTTRILYHFGHEWRNMCSNLVPGGRYTKVGPSFAVKKMTSSGSCGSSGKALGYGLDVLGSIPSVGGVEIFFTLSYPDCSWGPHNSYKMSTGGKGGRA